MDETRYIGRGIGLAVMDTGAYPHPDFRDRITGFYDAVRGKQICYDDNGHGTHIAGIALGDGRSSDGKCVGMAPGAHLIPVKVLDWRGSGTVDQVLAGVEYLLGKQQELKIRVVNISMGAFDEEGMDEDTTLVRGVERLWDAGMVVLAAAGNNGPRSQTIATPGISRKLITVGCSDDDKETQVDGGRMRNYSGRGPTKACICKPDLVAPGCEIISCNRMVRPLDSPYTVKSGTSMSTPMVAGAVACLLEKYPYLTNAQVKLWLRDSCVRLEMPDSKQGWGLLCMEKLMR
ncbi:MAG: S8 family peptidase [Lachnospiraceae bacterium]|nr:S8 family peptidase [Lachnospiraceae bacterium]